jgi:hypothetical protein
MEACSARGHTDGATTDKTQDQVEGFDGAIVWVWESIDMMLESVFVV